MEYQLNDIVAMKKVHACQSKLPVQKQRNEWKIVRMGADIKIKCMVCDRVVMMSRHEFEHKMKKIIKKVEE